MRRTCKISENVPNPPKRRKPSPAFLDLFSLEYERPAKASLADLLDLASRSVAALTTRLGPKFKVSAFNKGLLASSVVDLTGHCRAINVWEFLSNLCMAERVASAAVCPDRDEAKVWK